MFLGLHPDIAVITNVEWDHVDCYPNPADFQQAFAQFTGLVPPGGAVVYCGDDPGSRSLHDTAAQASVQWVSYGLNADNTWRASAIQANPAGGVDFDVLQHDVLLGRLSMPLPGEHNVRNALAALAAAALAGYNVFPQLRENLKISRIFIGTKRRLEITGVSYGIIVVDDYAHHPTEVRATLTRGTATLSPPSGWACSSPTRTAAPELC